MCCNFHEVGINFRGVLRGRMEVSWLYLIVQSSSRGTVTVPHLEAIVISERVCLADGVSKNQKNIRLWRLYILSLALIWLRPWTYEVG